MFDLIVIGGGPAGLAAACSAWDSGLRKILIVERDQELGGILNQCIHSGFGLQYFKEELTGPEYAARFVDLLAQTGVEVRLDTMVLQITPEREVHMVGKETGYCIEQAKAIILAMGCRERTRGAIAIPGTRPAGVFTAGAAQRYVNVEGYMPGRRVVILGSGDIGLIMARRMTLEGAKVLACVEVMPYSSGLNRNIVQCLEDFGIPLYLSHTVTKAYGRKRLEAIELSEVGEDRRPIPGTGVKIACDTLVLSIGLMPLLSLLRPLGLKKNRSGQIEVDDSFMSSLPGLFMAGNALHVHDLVDNVALEAEAAGREAARFALGKRERGGRHLLAKAGDGIGYLIPGLIEEGGEESVLFRFRSARPNKDCYIEFVQGDKTIKKIRKLTVIPSEMEFVRIPKKILDFNQETTIEVRLCPLS